MTALYYRVGEMRRANHDSTDCTRDCCRVLQQLLEGRDNTTGHIGRGGRFDPTDDLPALHQDCICVRPADINADALLHCGLPLCHIHPRHCCCLKPS